MAEWKVRLEDRLDKAMMTWSMLNQSQIIDFNDVNAPDKYSGYVYDAVWLYALALDKLIKHDKALIQDLHSEETINEFVKIIKNLDFLGVSGRVNFIDGNSRLSETRIIQHQVTKAQLVEKADIGLYVPEYPNISSSILWYDEEIKWKTVGGEKPTDEERSCGALTGLSVLFNLECQHIITVTLITSLLVVLVALIGLSVGLKLRYEKKMLEHWRTEQRTE